MSKSFAGKTIAITGASGGIGQWLCKFFGEEGATIAALDLSEKVLALPETLGRQGITVMAATPVQICGDGSSPSSGSRNSASRYAKGFQPTKAVRLSGWISSTCQKTGVKNIIT